MTLIFVIIFFTILAITTPFILIKAFPHRITWKEVGLSVFISLVITVLSFFVALGNIYNVEILNGKVTNKKQVRTSCEHSYQICTPSTDANGNTTSNCVTYYEHSHDYDWRVYTTVGSINISRVDRRGVREPKRFTQVKIGEPASKESRYIDYIKGSNSVFNLEENIQEGHAFEKRVPNYPRVSDYYNVDLIKSTYAIDQKIIRDLNDKLRNRLIALNNRGKINVIIVITDKDSSYGEYIKARWNNGRKTDAVIVIGTNGNDDTENSNKIEWSMVFGWSDKQTFNVNLRNEIINIENIKNTDKIVDTISNNVTQYFKLKPMEDYKYLMFERNVGKWQIVFIFLFQIIGNLLVSWFNYKNVNGSMARKISNILNRRRY